MDFGTLKQLGNDAVRDGRWDVAVGHYTAALQIDSTSEAAAALYSNRCSCYVPLFKFDLALLDANRAIKLRPNWSKAYARRGEVFGHLRAFHFAQRAYIEAGRRAEDDAARRRYATSAESFARKASKVDAGGAAHLGGAIIRPGDESWRSRMDAQIASGVPLAPLSIAEALNSAWASCHGAMSEINEGFHRNPDGSFRGPETIPLYDVAVCLITHSDGMHLVGGYDPSHPIQVKVTDMIKFDATRFGYMKFLAVGSLPSDAIDHFDRRRLAEGWKEPRKALTAMISGLVVGAILSCLQGDIGGGMISIRYASGLIKTGLERWTPGEDEERTCGPCFSLGFRRGVDVRLLVYLEQGFLGAQNELIRQAFQLEEIDTRARELLEDLEANPIHPEAGVQYTAFQVIATAVANKSRGLVLYTASESDEEKVTHSILHFKGMESSRAAGRFYLAAGRVLPEDSEDRPGCFYRALSLSLRGGGITIREAFARGAEAEQAMIPPERIFGESNRKFEDRTFVRIQLDAMRDWIESGQGLILNYTEADGVTRIPDPLDITIQPIPTLYMEDMPPSGNPMDVVDQEFMRSLPGHVGLVDVMGKKPVGKPTPIRRGGAP